MRGVLLLVTLLMLAVAAPALALQSGGEDGTQFPEGTSDCSGDRQHHGHTIPTDACVRYHNAHYATDMGGGEVCTSRAKLCSSCYGCCDLQRTEAEKCHCYGDDHCLATLGYTQQKCKENCLGHFLDSCA